MQFVYYLHADWIMSKSGHATYSNKALFSWEYHEFEHVSTTLFDAILSKKKHIQTHFPGIDWRAYVGGTRLRGHIL